MTEENASLGNTIIIYFPFEFKMLKKCYLIGELDDFNNSVQIFFTTKILESVSKYNETESDGKRRKIKTSSDWIYVEINKNHLSVRQVKIHGKLTSVVGLQIIWIAYDLTAFSQTEVSETTLQNYGSHFKCFQKKIHQRIDSERKKRKIYGNKLVQIVFALFSVTVLTLSDYSKKLLPFTGYFNIAIHIDNYLKGILWAVEKTKEKKKLDIKVINFCLSLLLDMVLGIIFLKWVNSKVSLDSFPKLFLLTAESIVNSIKDLLSWLKGDPAGLKLNTAFNKVLAMFFSFHIDIWWTFLAFLNPVIKVIFQIFLQLGLFGISFQASITADLLALVSFHVYCIYAYAAKIYNIQILSLISLWRLFLGRKKNPLREKVDSCKYSPEQLFVGTLGFTILLFLLPTTLLYYFVFTCIRISTLFLGAVLKVATYLNQTTPVYSTVLWLLKSSKVSSNIEVKCYRGSIKSKFLILKAQPITYSWWETVVYFTPDCVEKPSGFKMSDFINSIITGKLLFPF